MLEGRGWGEDVVTFLTDAPGPDWLPVIQAEHRTELLSSQPGLVSLIIFLMMDFPQKIFLMNFVTIVLSHPWQTWQAAFNQYFKKFA